MANFIFSYSTSSAPTVDIVVHHPATLVAPAQIWLKAVNYSGLADFEESGSVYDGPHHEYYHEWTIDGQPLAAWSRPENLAPGHNNPNKAFGREVAFCLPVAGSYTIDLVVTDRTGRQATASTSTLTVIDAESYYSGSQTVYVDPDGLHAEAPAGVLAANRVTTLAEARARVIALNNDRTRVLFRRGKTYDFSTLNPAESGGTNGSFWISSGAKASYFGGYGSGTNPKMIRSTVANRNLNAMFNMRPAHNIIGFVTFSGLDFVGDWDPTVERGAVHGTGLGLYVDAPETYALAYQCDATGLEMGFGLSSRNGGRILLADCSVTDWRDYGIFGGEADSVHGLIGVRVKSDPAAQWGVNFSLTGSMGRNKDVLNGHGPCRLSRGRYVYLAGCDFFNANQGWDGNAQDALRLFVNPEAGQSAYVERCTFEGGYRVISLEDSLGQTDNPFNVVIERCLLLPTMGQTSGKIISPWRSGLTIRDCLMSVPDVAPYKNPTGEPAINLVAVGTQGPDNLSNPIVIHNNTYVNLLSAAHDNGKDWAFFENQGEAFTNTVQENNVVYKPGIGSDPAMTFAAMNITTAIPGVTPRYSLQAFGFQTVNFLLADDVAHGATVSVDYAIIHQKLGDGSTLGSTTDQAYWQAIEGSDTRHEILLYDVNPSTYKRLYAEHGHFTVTFGTSEVTITNTSGFIWTRGQNLYLNLDRTSLVPAPSNNWAAPPTVPLPRPDGIQPVTAGRVSPKDFLLKDRGDTPSWGAVEPL